MNNSLDKIYETFGANICLAPYISTFYSIANNPPSVTPCSLIQDDNLWAVEDESLLSTVNNKRWVSLRENFNNGSCHTSPHCQRCSQIEKSNNISPRQLANAHFSEHISDDLISLIKEIQQNKFRINKILSVDYFPSNYCNYECVMCSGAASSSRQVYEIKYENKIFPKINNQLAKDFYPLIKSTKLINFTGGETILQNKVHELINYLTEHDLTDKKISLLTNASSFPVKYINEMKKFDDVFYTVSIDGIGKVIEYQRRGADWNTVEANALQIHKEFSSVINYLLTPINIFSFVDFVEWAFQNKLDKIIISQVTNPDYYSVATVPNELRSIIVDRLEQGKQKFSNEKFIALIDTVLTILNSTPHDSTLLPVFIRRIKKEDVVSKNKLVDVVPEWLPYFND